MYKILSKILVNKLKKVLPSVIANKQNAFLEGWSLLHSFWGEALYTAVHVINLTPTVILDSEVPDKIWFGKRDDVDSRKSTSSYLINFVGGAVAWQSRLQRCVALDT
uniref:Retrovirus-related Pol polyprotein from transposon TNT 1-94 n=1 Tax=Cajanus cajan TaxID=3821 RepID=A0A151RFF5_CAJCA|nr:Retrovirus-related Pol polyprotein from transposon TNT 1-94 [Cajanus cajan]